MPEKRTCPKCKKMYAGFPAISREDNKTEICPDCGIQEAIEAMANGSKAELVIFGNKEE